MCSRLQRWLARETHSYWPSRNSVKTRFLIAILVTACIAGLRPEAHAEDNSIRVQMTHEFSVGKIGTSWNPTISRGFAVRCRE